MASVEPNLAQLPQDKKNEVPTSPVEQAVVGESLLPITQEEERISIASNWTLVWLRFRKNKLAVISAGILLFLVIIVLFPEFFATVDP